MKTTLTQIALLSIGLAATVPARAQQVLTNPEVNEAIQSDVSPPVGALVLKASAAGSASTAEAQESRRRKLPQLLDAARKGALAPASAGPRKAASSLSLPVSIGVNVLGVGNGFPNYFVPDAPSDV